MWSGMQPSLYRRWSVCLCVPPTCGHSVHATSAGCYTTRWWRIALVLVRTVLTDLNAAAVLARSVTARHRDEPRVRMAPPAAAWRRHRGCTRTILLM